MNDKNIRRLAEYLARSEHGEEILQALALAAAMTEGGRKDDSLDFTREGDKDA